MKIGARREFGVVDAVNPLTGQEPSVARIVVDDAENSKGLCVMVAPAQVGNAHSPSRTLSANPSRLEGKRPISVTSRRLPRRS